MGSGVPSNSLRWGDGGRLVLRPGSSCTVSAGGRNRALAGFKFRRQHPFCPYIVDFYCADARLAVEVDGDTHDSVEEVRRDAVRTEELRRRGVRVLRFSNLDVVRDIDLVLAAILDALESPSP